MWNEATVTNAGLAVYNRWLGGEALTLTAAKGGNSVTDDPAAATDLINTMQTLTISGTEAADGGHRVKVQVTSTGLTAGYTLRQVGIWGRIGSETPVLLILLQDAEGVPVPSAAANADFVFELSAFVQAVSAGDFSAAVDPHALVSRSAMTAAVSAAVVAHDASGSAHADIRLQLTSPFNFKGSVTDLPALAAVSSPAQNDTYYVVAEKCRYSYTGTEWKQSSMDEGDYADELAGAKNYTDEVNSKLTASANLIDYGGDALHKLNANPSSTSTTRLGIRRENCVFTLTGRSYSSAATRVRANGTMTRTDSGATVRSWTTSNFALIPGRTYRIWYRRLTSTLDPTTVGISVYRAGESSTVGTPGTLEDGLERVFTADTAAYNIVLYVKEDTTFSEDSLVLLLEDITDNHMQRDNRTDAIHRLVDYGGDTVHNLNANASATNTTTLGVHREKSVFTLTGKSYYNGPMRVKANGTMQRTDSGEIVRDWTTDPVTLVPGRTYRVFFKILSGSAVHGNVSVSVYRVGESSTVGHGDTRQDGFERIFTADTDEYNLALYFAQNITFSSDKIWLALEDITELQDHYFDEMEDTVAKVRAAADEPALVFPLVTDLHCYTGDVFAYPQTIRLLRHFVERVPCDLLVNLGDSINGDKAQAVSLQEAYTVTQDLLSLGLPYYAANGNHDNNPYTDASSSQKFSLGQDYNALFSGTRDMVPYRADNGTSYYVDLPHADVRLVVLNSCNVAVAANYGFSAGLADWLADDALDTDRVVLLLSHMSSISTQLWGNNDASKIPANHQAVTAAIQAFVDRGGTVIQLNGHSHVDYEFVDPWICVTNCSAKFNNVDITAEGYQAITGFLSTVRSPERTALDATEDSWTVCIYKPWSGEFDMIRFGAGVDRYFHIAPITPRTVTTKLTGTVTWTSSDTSVATVSGGVISRAGAGRCAVYAKDSTGNLEIWTVDIAP